MKKWLGKLSRKWLVTGLAIILLLTCSGIVYGAGLVVVHFGGGVGVTGAIHVTAPSPTEADVVVISSPVFNLTSGDITPISAVIIVQNNSAYDLILTLAEFNIDSAAYLGYFSYNPEVTPGLKAHSQHSIPVAFNPVAQMPLGDFTYSGTLTYSW